MAKPEEISCTFLNHTQETIWRADNDVTAISQLHLNHHTQCTAHQHILYTLSATITL